MARFLRSSLAGVALLAVLAAPAHAQVPTEVEELRTRVEQTETALDEAAQEQARIADEVTTARQELEAADVAVATAERELEEAETQLAEAKQSLADAEVAHARATDEVARASRRLLLAQERLDRATTALHEQIGAAYRYAGSTAYMTAAMDALSGRRTLTEYLTALERLEIGTGRQRDVVGEVEDALHQVQAITEEVAARRDARARERDRAGEAADEVQALADAQAEALVALEATRTERESLVAQLEADAAHAEELTRQLLAESQALQEELSTYEGLAGAPGDGGLLWPTDGQMTSRFGPRLHPIHKTQRMHEGIDIPAPTGQAVIAAADGAVISAGRRGGYGLTVIIDHGDGISTLSAHLSRIDVRAGQVVRAGDIIGAIGSTGQSTGPHLHFEIRRDGVPVDPAAWF